MPTTFDLTLVPDGDELTYSLGAPSSEVLDQIQGRFLTQFLSIANSETLRGTVFMQALANGQIRTNADIVTLVATAGAQIRTLERELANNIILESVNLLAVEFINLTTIKLSVRLNTTSGSIVNDIVVTA